MILAPYLKMPPVAPGMKIGLFGGSFNPPHEGHLLVANTALRRLQLDQIWWMVTPGNPLKDHSFLKPLEERIKASEDLVTNHKIHTTAFEAALRSPYSAATVQTILARCPAVHFVWIMGADSLATFHLWHHWRTIVQSLPIAVIDRAQARMSALSSPMAQIYKNARIDESDAAKLALMSPPAWVYLHGPRSPLSSTLLRQKAYCQDAG